MPRYLNDGPARRADGEGRRLLGEMLVEAGLVTRDGLDAGLEEQRLRGGRLGFTLLKTGRVGTAAFHLFLQDNLAGVASDLTDALRQGLSVDRIPARLAHHYGIVPAQEEGGVLHLAVSAADAPGLMPALEELTGLKVEPLVCPPSLIAEALERFYASEVEPGVLYRTAGDHVLVLSDRRSGIRPHLPEVLRPGARSAEWLRAIAVEGVHHRARRIQIEPHPEEMRVIFRGPGGETTRLYLPRSAFAGVGRLIEGLSRIAARGRVVPREGRMALAVDGRVLNAAVRAVPGFEGDAYTLDLRDDRVLAQDEEALSAELPGLVAVARRLAGEGRGLLLLAGAEPAEAQAGLRALLTLLGDRLPRRFGLAPQEPGLGITVIEDSAAGGAAAGALLERADGARADLVVLPALQNSDDMARALARSRERAVLALVVAADAYAAAEWAARSGCGAGDEEQLLGILATRLIETLCLFCKRPYDLHDLLSPGPRHRAIPEGPYQTNAGCAACRGSGARLLEPVFEFLPLGPGGGLLRPGATARQIREMGAGRGVPTFFAAALRKAAAGLIDVREPLRILINEQR